MRYLLTIGLILIGGAAYANTVKPVTKPVTKSVVKTFAEGAAGTPIGGGGSGDFSATDFNSTDFNT